MNKTFLKVVAWLSLFGMTYFIYTEFAYVRVSTQYHLNIHRSPTHNLWIGTKCFENVMWEDPYYYKLDVNHIVFEVPDGVRIVQIKPFKVYKFDITMGTPSVYDSRREQNTVIIDNRAHGHKIVYRFDLATETAEVIN